MDKIAAIRKDYSFQQLTEKEVATDPITQFGKWWDEAVNSSIDEVNAMTLATATPEGKPSARVVLLKGFDENGFVFFTNYESHKGIELLTNPQASLVFFWKELERQVRIEGITEKVSSDESDAYFVSRPEGSRIGAWASPQSRVIEAREQIEINVNNYRELYAEREIPRPPHWGGYRVRPQLIEFWQGRPNRLHDRIQYSLQQGTGWNLQRLAP